jgi:hypothetical protein
MYAYEVTFKFASQYVHSNVSGTPILCIEDNG